MDRWRPIILSCLVLSMALGGCTDDGGDRDADRETDGGAGGGRDRDDGGDTQPGLATGLAPLWFPGLYWTYEVAGAGLDADATLGILVHGSEGPKAWRLHTDADAHLVTVLAQHGFPYLMTVDGEAFSYETHRGDHDLWDFPIEDTETWHATDHHGRALTAAAFRNTTTTPGGRTVDAYDLTFSHDGVVWLRTTYTPAVAGFTHADVDSDLDGTPDLELTLIDVGSTGKRSAYQPVEVRLAASSTATGPTTDTTSPTTFGVGADVATHLGAWAWMQGTTGIHRTTVTLGTEELFVFEWRNTNGTLAHHIQTAVAPYTETDGGSLGHVMVGDGTTAAEVVAVTIGAETAGARTD